jgi:hypothetical protein
MTSGVSDYTDVVTVASLQSSSSAKFVAWQNVSAAGRLGCTPESCFGFNETHAEQLNIAFKMLELPTKTLKPAPIPKPIPSSSAQSQPQKTETSGILGILRNIFK